MAYPTSVTTFTTRNAGDTIAAEHVNTLGTEVNAIEDGLLNGFSHAIQLTATAGIVSMDTTDGSDSKQLYLCGGGTLGSSRGAYLLLNGNEQAGTPGELQIVAGGSTGRVQFINNAVLTAQFDDSGHLAMASNKNIGVGSTTYGASAANALALTNGNPGAEVANAVKIASVDRSAGNTILAIQTEGAGVLSSGTVATSTNAMAIQINGTVYFIPCSTAAPS